MDMAEFIVLQGVRDTDTQEKVEGYLAWKWGLEGDLPNDHTYKDAAPTVGPDPPFAITEIEYDPGAEPNPTVTLTWRSRPGVTYKAFVSTDLSNWESELVDSLGPDTEGIIVDGALLTMSFDLTEFGLEGETDLFFRMEEQ